MATDGVGLYIHIPFCKRKCNYCDFFSVTGADRSLMSRYTDALIREIMSYRREEPITVRTVYLGGGTPSLLPIDLHARILSAVREVFCLLPNSEITLEANPGTLNKEALRALRGLGYNRISFGLQSIHENELKKLGRIHTCEDFLSVYYAAREAGFDNISVDLMYGIPDGTRESLASTLKAVTELSPEHISLYGLIIEEGTPFYKEESNLALPDTDTECDMYEWASDFLSSLGYSHYEISNYARAGYESQHNLIYWRDEEYIGIGPAAHSYFSSVRYGNSSSLDEYFSETYEKYRCTEHIDKSCEMYEYAMMRLRLSEGISLSEYKSRFGISFTEGKEDILSRLIDGGYVCISGDRLFLTDKGMYVNNMILTDIL